MKKIVLYFAILAAIVIMAKLANYADSKLYEKEISDLKYKLAHAQIHVPVRRLSWLSSATCAASTSSMKRLSRNLD